jgi:hypothetical protein
MTRLWAETPGSLTSIAGKGRELFSLSFHPDHHRDLPNLLTEAFFPGVNRTRREADHQPSSSPEKLGVIPPIPMRLYDMCLII